MKNRHHLNLLAGRAAAFSLAAVLGMGFPGNVFAEADEEATSEEASASEEEEITTFLKAPFYDGVIENEDDALACIQSVITQLGGDENTDLEPTVIRPNEDGVSYYTFRQMAGDVAVYGASVKLIVNADGQAAAVVSSIQPGISDAKMSDWAISDEEAEKIVAETCGNKGMEVVKNATEQTLLPFEDDSSSFYYAWVVYTNNTDPAYDTAYTAHYVDAEGEYLYSLPVAEPGNADSLYGTGSSLTFHGYESSTWSGTVTKHDGSTKDITVPTMIDPDTGAEYLGDVERMILCADAAAFDFADTVRPREKSASEANGWSDQELLIYDAVIRVYDLYKDIGWEAPDGDGSPVILLMDWVDEDGVPVQNACYSGRKHGFQTFHFNRLDPDGECTDIIAHEYTHCLTDTMLTTTLYFNEYGAMNEALSDICGNLIESILGDSDDEEWLIGEQGEEFLRCMSDPNRYEQPAYVWDTYYVPPVDYITNFNDNGGVHINSSLLNLVAYRLHEAGMPEGDELYFWLNVEMALTPRSGYDTLMDLLPWCLQEAGFADYTDALNAALEEVRIGDTSVPEVVPDDAAWISLEMPESESDHDYSVAVLIVDTDSGKQYITWPGSGSVIVNTAVPEGNYTPVLMFFINDNRIPVDAVLTGDGWEMIGSDEEDGLIDNRDDLVIFEASNGTLCDADTANLDEIMSALTQQLSEGSVEEVDEDPTGLRSRWEGLFTAGAEGENANGDKFYFAFDDPQAMSVGAFIITDAEGEKLYLYMLGDIGTDEDGPVLHDVDGANDMNFWFTDTEVEDGFELRFSDGDTARMHFTDQKTILSDMLDIVDRLT